VDGPRLRKRICALLPPKHQGEVLRVWDLATEKTGSYLAARTLLAGLSAIFHAVVFAIIGVPYALPMGIWLGVVSQVIPIIGTYLAIGLPVVLALAEQHPGTALVAIVIAALYQQVENVVLTPKLTAKAVDVHPGVGFVAILVAAAAFGPVYSLLIIPVIATIQGFIVAYIKTHELIDDPRLNTGPIPPVKETSGDIVTRRSAKLKGSKGRREGSRSE
jgi:predicted PurR-regulated permease PerM